MKVRDVGEFGLIAILANMISDHPHAGDLQFELRLGVGDDAAAWQLGDVTELITTDTMVENVHFSHSYTSWEDLGWKSIVVNMSDIASMGAIPIYALVTLGLRHDADVEDIKSMYYGMLHACRKFGCQIIGGDVVNSPVTFVTIAMTGYTRSGVLTRNSVRPGDVVAVTGYLGSSAGGLRLLQGGYDESNAGHIELVKNHNNPLPKIRDGGILASNGVRSAMDISDGLVGDLSKMCLRSGVGAVLRTKDVPMGKSLRREFSQDCLNLALYGGEDYEILFTGPVDLVSKLLPQLSPGASILGEIIVDVPGRIMLEDSTKNRVEVIKENGWDHFINA